MNEDIKGIISKIFQNDPDKIIFSNPSVKSAAEFRKIVFNKKFIKNESVFQMEKYTDKQVFHKNITRDLLCDSLADCFEKPYKQVNVYSAGLQMEIRINRNGDFHITQKHIDNAVPKIMNRANNRTKNYILCEGMDIPVFKELGIFTDDLKVRNQMQDKFRQINRFTEFIDDCIRDYHRDEINVIDFGCGKSYLTFIVYHYLKNIKNIRPHIIGLDLKEDVIKRCNDLTEKFGYDDLCFKVGDINGFTPPFERVDMVLTLHACDTATDYALYNAIKWHADMILSVPCCQHEINRQLETERLSALTRYGLVKERVSALITDSIRGCMLEYSGYRTDLMEFVEIEHSPKNILIRGRKRNLSLEKRKKALNEAEELCREFNIRQKLMELLLN